LISPALALFAISFLSYILAPLVPGLAVTLSYHGKGSAYQIS
jgi:hypothetical protein